MDANGGLPFTTGAMSPSTSSARTVASMAIAAILCVQLGLAASVGLFDDVGPEGAACLRLSWAGLILLAVVRPRRGTYPRAVLPGAIALGVVTAGVTMLFMAAVDHLPLGRRWRWSSSDRSG